MEKHLKPYLHYSDLYDRHTVERCRMTEKWWNESDVPAYEGKEFSEEQKAGLKDSMLKFYMRFQTGDRYINKEKVIREWMDADQKRDELYENAQPPEDIRCLTCRKLLKVTFKELWSELDKPDRVLFMYDCPNNCMPRRAFFSDGQEWRPRPNLCPRCDAVLDHTGNNDDGKKIVITYICPKCGYIKTDEYVWAEKKEEEIDENFGKDRERFCLTEEQGREYSDMKYSLEQMGKLSEEWKKTGKRMGG